VNARASAVVIVISRCSLALGLASNPGERFRIDPAPRST
jgi:hypothetical protein